MKKLAIFGVALLSLSFSFQASAELVEADWKTEGDGLITIDTVTGLKWLDVSYTDNVAISTVMNELSTTYQGWAIADIDQVQELILNHFGLNSEGTGSAVDVTDWQYHFGITGTGGRSYGSYVVNGRTHMSGSRNNRTVYVNYGRSNNQSTPNDYDGVFLVSSNLITLDEINNNTADVPAPWAAYSLLLSVLFWRRRQKN